MELLVVEVQDWVGAAEVEMAKGAMEVEPQAGAASEEVGWVGEATAAVVRAVAA